MNNMNYLHVWKTIELREIYLFSQLKGSHICIPFRSVAHLYSTT